VDSLNRLIAKSDIEDCLKRYARGVDRRDWALVKACFFADAQDHHGEFLGDREQFVEWVRDRHAQVPFSMHYLQNCLVEFITDSSAAVETYFWALQRRELTDENGAVTGTDIEVFGRYLDIFEKRDNDWRIADRKVAYDSTRQMPSTNKIRKLVGVLGCRNGNDPVYRRNQAAE
jgi:3-phenylpropionate/cinnamic acid dioxygenase small subunit